MAEDEDKEVSIYGHQHNASTGQNIGLNNAGHFLAGKTEGKTTPFMVGFNINFNVFLGLV